MALEGKSLHFLPPWPSGSPPLPVRQGAGRELCSGFSAEWGEDGRSWKASPKEQIPRGRIRLPCVEGQHGWHVEIEIKQHASTLNYSYK